jgi:hypothetical protein
MATGRRRGVLAFVTAASWAGTAPDVFLVAIPSPRVNYREIILAKAERV